MQSDPSKYKSLLPATATIVREEGPQALVKGLGPTLVGYGIEGALKFGVYEVSKPLVVAAFAALSAKLKVKSGSGGALPFLLASLAAGAVASLVLVPMESTRIRMVTDPSFEGLGLLSGLAQLVKESGLISTLTVGMGAMLAKQVSTYSESRLSMYHISFKSRNLPCLSIYRFLTLLANK
jgi:solute carrier family 25 phosphate transporter 3